jgi:hypothetical protein
MANDVFAAHTDGDETDYKKLLVDSSGNLKVALTTGSLATKNIVDKVRHDYSSVNVTTGAYVELVASLAADVTAIEVFDSSGRIINFAVGAAASEVDKLFITPGGNEDLIGVQLSSGDRIAIKAVDGNATVGDIVINFIG